MSRNIQKPVRWTTEEWAAVVEAATAARIAPTNFVRIFVLAGIAPDAGLHALVAKARKRFRQANGGAK